MKIHAYILCWNEELLTPFMLDYYAKFVDKLHILDNGSTDKTLELIKKETRFEIEIIPYNSDNKLNDQKHIEIKNNIWKESRGQADFVWISDFDEFPFALDMQKELQYMFDNQQTICYPEIYDLYSLNFPDYQKDKLLHEIVQFGVHNQSFGKQALFNPNKIKEINYSPGAHSCQPIGDVKYYDKHDIYLFHGKNISIDYVANRHIEYKKRLSAINKERGWGIHYNHTKKEVEDTIRTWKNKASNINYSLTQKKKIFIDGGARLGEALPLLSKIHPDIKDINIYMFECNSNHIKTLKKLQEKDKRIKEVYNEAIWIKDEIRPFYISIDKWNDLGCTLKPEKQEKLDREHPINVKCIDFSTYLEQFKDNYVILKLDIEGSEYEVLNHLIETGNIKYINELYIEFHDSFFNIDSKPLKDKLIELNIDCHFDWV